MAKRRLSSQKSQIFITKISKTLINRETGRLGTVFPQEGAARPILRCAFKFEVLDARAESKE